MKEDSSCCQGGVNEESEGSCMCMEEEQADKKAKIKGKAAKEEHLCGCCGH